MTNIETIMEKHEKGLEEQLSYNNIHGVFPTGELLSFNNVHNIIRLSNKLVKKIANAKSTYKTKEYFEEVRTDFSVTTTVAQKISRLAQRDDIEIIDAKLDKSKKSYAYDEGTVRYKLTTETIKHHCKKCDSPEIRTVIEPQVFSGNTFGLTSYCEICKKDNSINKVFYLSHD